MTVARGEEFIQMSEVSPLPCTPIMIYKQIVSTCPIRIATKAPTVVLAAS